jgi:hypothetical protein
VRGRKNTRFVRVPLVIWLFVEATHQKDYAILFVLIDKAIVSPLWVTNKNISIAILLS